MNTKNPHYKEKRKLDRELRKNYEIQRNQNWIDLEVPYINGYYKVLDLRDDIKNRDDAWVFYECIKIIGTRVWCRDDSFRVKTGKGKYEYLYAGYHDRISQDLYDSLHPAVKKYFKPSLYINSWRPEIKYYYCTVPNHFFVEKVVPRWITQYKEVDCLLLQEEAELEDKLKEERFRPFSWYAGRGPSKNYRADYTRSDRRHSKQTVKRNINSGGDYDKYEYRYGHKHSATWDWW